MNEVKLHILPKEHSGPVAWVAEPLTPRPIPFLCRPFDVPGDRRPLARMAYYGGILYTDTPPDQWQPVDVDRAAALGYGERCAWPVNPKRAPPADLPPIIKPIRVDDLTSGHQIAQARRNKLATLNALIRPRLTAHINTNAIRAFETATGREMALPLYRFDELTVTQLAHDIRERLK